MNDTTRKQNDDPQDFSKHQRRAKTHRVDLAGMATGQVQNGTAQEQYRKFWVDCMNDCDWQSATTQKQAVEMVRDLFYARHPYPKINQDTDVGAIYMYYDSTVITGITRVEHEYDALKAVSND